MSHNDSPGASAASASASHPALSPASAPHRHTNRLIHATSPYLLQHAHNPVDWFPWGEEALRKARDEDKPIFLSIGYAACHWCHVMERESFENDAVAAVLNRDFVAIKVDREERPDLDDLYMKATQLFNRGGGGWPMSVFLTPDGRPFFAGTYFPPDNRYGRPGFKDLLEGIAAVWKQRRDDVHKQADGLTEAVKQISAVESAGAMVAPDIVQRSAEAMARAFDREKGGISGGGTTKFPPSMAMDLLLREQHRAAAAGQSNDDGLSLVTLTLDRMARGGIYDHLAGGIARYSTDVDWLVPHFEKMLYDQALVSGIYLDAFVATGRKAFGRVAGDILDYVIADLQSPGGGFYSTRDADSEGEEGRYYVWSRAEVEAALGGDAALFCDYYDVSTAGNWEGRNILNIPRDLETVARSHGSSEKDAASRLATARRALLAIRARRTPPLLDDKILASWNGLMISSMARAARILEQPRYEEAAERAANFVWTRMRRADGRLLRTCRNDAAHTLAYLDDHAFMLEGLLHLYETTGRLEWLERATELNETLKRHFRDEAGGYFFSPDDGEKLLVRAKDASDGAIPSGNAVQLMNLLRLAVLLGDKSVQVDAEKLIQCFADSMSKSIFSSERMLAAVDFQQRRPREIVLVYPADRRGLAELEQVTWSTYVPNKVVVHVPFGTPEADSIARRIPLAAEKKPLDGRAAAYVCRDFACRAPTADPAELRRQLTAP